VGINKLQMSENKAFSRLFELIHNRTQWMALVFIGVEFSGSATGELIKQNFIYEKHL
jgi:hypothetical protein